MVHTTAKVLSDCILDQLKCSPQLLCRSLNQVCPGSVEFKSVCMCVLFECVSVCVHMHMIIGTGK